MNHEESVLVKILNELFPLLTLVSFILCLQIKWYQGHVKIIIISIYMVLIFQQAVICFIFLEQFKLYVNWLENLYYVVKSN